MSDTALSDRMKNQYENRTRYFLPRRTYTILRVDGRAFHTLLRNAERPFDDNVMAAMDEAAVSLCEKIQGASFAYTQSDEVSVCIGDFKTITSDAWFDGNLQKIVSVASSIATVAFNARWGGHATFDARAFTIPDPIEVENYFIWRQQDAIRNSIAMAAQALYSHKELLNKNCDEQQEMIYQKGINWNEYPARAKRGSVCVYRATCTIDHKTWQAEEPPVFTQDRTYLKALLPIRED